MKKKLFTLSENASLEYCAAICRIGEVKPIEGSDFLGQTVVFGQNLVVRKDEMKEGDIVVYCPIETVLNKGFLSTNNLYEMGEKERNSNFKEVQQLCDEGKTDEAKSKVGFFNKHGRIKILTLRKVPSVGFIFKPENLLKWKPNLDLSDLESYMNQQFDTIDGEMFIKVYVPVIPNQHTRDGNRMRRKNEKKIKRMSRMIAGEFSFHYDTNQLNNNMWRIGPTDKVTITLKVHGCVQKDSIINTKEYGDLTIGEIVDNKIDCHIKAFDVSNGEIVYVPIDKHYMIPNDGEWYEVELENGTKLIITGNNPVWLPKLETYKRVDELNGDEYVLID